MNIMAAVDANWAIGYQNKLLVRIPNDHKRMREQTTGKVIIMGRKTLESFPQAYFFEFLQFRFLILPALPKFDGQ